MNSQPPQGTDLTHSAIRDITPRAKEDQPPKTIKPKKKRSRKRWVAIGIVIVILLVPLYFGVKLFLATRSIITKNTFHSAAALVGGDLKGEGDGRINILIMGIGGVGHEGPELTDTIILASIDPKAHSVSMLSIPRDLYVKNSYCPAGCKINAINSFGEENGKGEGATDLKATVSKILDVPVHYYVKVDFSGFKSAVDAVGGVDINVPKTLYDPYYPNDKGGQTPLYVTAGLHHMNGDLALRYSRSRETTSDYDRAARQQQVLTALREKALSLGTLTNPKKVSDLIDAIGSHVKTDLQLWELQKLTGIIKDLDKSKMQNKVLDPTSTNGLLLSGSDPHAGFIIYPAAGISQYSAIQQWVHTYLTDSYLTSESAKISLYNGTNQNGIASKTSDFLKAYNYDIVAVTNAPPGNYPTTSIIDYTGGKKPYTIKFLENRFHVTATKAPASQSVDGSDIKLLLGDNFKLSYINSQ